MRVQQFLFDLGGVVLTLAIAGIYLQNLFVQDLKGFIEISGVVFAGLATLCGLSLGFSSVIESPDDKWKATNAGEKLLHGSLYFLFAALLGYISLKIEYLGKGRLALEGVNTILIILGCYFLIMAFWTVHYGVMWLSDLLWLRWNRRIKRGSEGLVQNQS